MSEQQPSFKASMERLDNIVNALEKNDIALEEAICLFEEGLQLVTACDEQLKHFEHKVTDLLKHYQEGTDHE